VTCKFRKERVFLARRITISLSAETLGSYLKPNGAATRRIAAAFDKQRSLADFIVRYSTTYSTP
jgi:hypothetical protein